MGKSLFEKVFFLYIILLFIQPERIISYYFPAVKIINGIPTGVFFLLIGVWLFSDKSERAEKVPLFRLLVVFIFCIGLSSLFARNTGRARLVLYPMIYYLVFYYLLLSYYMNSEERFEKLFRVYLCGIIIFGILGFMHGGKLPFIPELNDEDALGPLFTMAIAFPGFLAISMEERRKKYVYFFMTIFCIAVVVITHARGAGIALAIVLVYMLLRLQKKLKVVVSVVIIGILVFGFLGSSLMKTSYVTEMRSILTEYEKIQRKEGTGASRMFLWKMGIKIFSTSPIIGVGPINFGVHLPDYAEKHRDEQVGLAYYGQIIHNGYLELLVGTGVIGCSIFFALLIGSFQMNRRTRRLLDKMKKIEESHEDELPLSRDILSRYYNLTFAIETSQIAFMINMMFYGIIYYKKFYWFLLVISASLYMVVVSTFKKVNEFSQRGRSNRI